MSDEIRFNSKAIKVSTVYSFLISIFLVAIIMESFIGEPDRVTELYNSEGERTNLHTPGFSIGEQVYMNLVSYETNLDSSVVITFTRGVDMEIVDVTGYSLAKGKTVEIPTGIEDALDDEKSCSWYMSANYKGKAIRIGEPAEFTATCN